MCGILIADTTICRCLLFIPGGYAIILNVSYLLAISTFNTVSQVPFVVPVRVSVALSLLLIENYFVHSEYQPPVFSLDFRYI